MGCNPDEYDRILVAFSGGKDSLACALLLLDMGLGPKMELHHHDVDGGQPLMDWPITPSYCRAVAAHLGLPIYFSEKVGGFERELLRDGTPTAPTSFDTPTGRVTVGGKGPPGTRLKFPAVQADLRVRWCSAYLKIDVFAAQLRNDPRFEEGRSLVITGERAEESTNRARYAVFERHRAASSKRDIDHWRPIHAWDEKRVWDLIERWGIVPHPAYELGWGRLSCRACIFGSADQWASVRAVAPAAFERIAAYEEQFGHTIRKGRSVRDLAEAGTAYPYLWDDNLLAKANRTTWEGAVVRKPWMLPPGAMSRDKAGPT